MSILQSIKELEKAYQLTSPIAPLKLSDALVQQRAQQMPSILTQNFQTKTTTPAVFTPEVAATHPSLTKGIYAGAKVTQQAIKKVMTPESVESRVSKKITQGKTQEQAQKEAKDEYYKDQVMFAVTGFFSGLKTVGTKALAKLMPEDIKIAEMFIDYARTASKKVQPELETAARYLAEGLGLEHNIPNAKLATQLEDVVARWAKIEKPVAPAAKVLKDYKVTPVGEPLAQEAKITLYHGTESLAGGKISKEGLRYGDFLTTSEKEALDYAQMRAKQAGTKPIVKEFQFNKNEVKFNSSTNEWQYLGGKEKLTGKYPQNFYKEYNDYFGSNMTAKEIDAQTDVWDVAKAISGYDELKAKQLLGQEAGKVEEQVLSDIFKQELVAQKTEGRLDLASDIKKLGGIKVSGGIKEETMGNVPLNLLNKKGQSVDEMAQELNSLGYKNITEGNDLLNELGDLYGGKVSRTPKSIFSKVATETNAIKTQRTKSLSLAEQEYQSRLTNIEQSAKDAGILPDEIDELTDRISLPKEIAQDKNGVKIPVGRGGIMPPEFDFTKWTDKGTLSLSRETLERNLNRVAGKDAPMAQEFLVNASRDNETMRTKFVNNLRTSAKNLVDKLKISAGSKDDALIQRYGEGVITLDELKTQTKNWKNVSEASDYFSKTYDELLDLVNQTRAVFNYKPIPKRQDYFRHFQELGGIIDQFGILLRENDLPTEIAGLTDMFKPGKPFSTAELQRLGGKYTESAIRGMDNYLNSISKQIFHIDTVQRGRVMEKYIRNAAKEGMANLPNTVANLMEWTNLISGKKARFDRAFESLLGRPFYSGVNWLRSRTSSNMILGNVSSALTNFIPITQFAATTAKTKVLRGAFESLMSPLKKSFSEISGLESKFLVRRYPEKYISPTFIQSTKNFLGFLFETIDKFSSKMIVSGKFYENLSKGMTREEAIKLADSYAGKVLADRSAGQLPNLMGSRSLGILTQFQTEINNMYSFLVRDIPNLAEGKKSKILSSLIQFTIYSYLFNELYQKTTGRRVSLDPLWTALTVAGLTAEGEGKPIGQRLTTAGEETLGNLPFTGGITSGRFPISAGIPDVGGLLQGKTTIGKELVKPVAFVVSPFAGLQVKKTIEGLSAYAKRNIKTKAGKTKYRIQQNITNLVKAGLFGQYSFPEAQKYFQDIGKKAKAKFNL